MGLFGADGRLRQESEQGAAHLLGDASLNPSLFSLARLPSRSERMSDWVSPLVKRAFTQVLRCKSEESARLTCKHVASGGNPGETKPGPF